VDDELKSRLTEVELQGIYALIVWRGFKNIASTEQPTLGKSRAAKSVAGEEASPGGQKT
jgi:hypothetical protein